MLLVHGQPCSQAPPWEQPWFPLLVLLANNGSWVGPWDEANKQPHGTYSTTGVADVSWCQLPVVMMKGHTMCTQKPARQTRQL